MTYVALLRAINVGGNNIISMLDLKAAFEKAGYTNVRSYINSGNVVFDSNDDKKKIETSLEEMLSKRFNYIASLIVRTGNEIEEIVTNVPSDWNSDPDIRCYVAFLKDHVTADDVMNEIDLNPDVDSVKAGTDVLYFTTKASGLTDSGLAKMNQKKIAKALTMRNFNTTKKLASMLETSA